MLRLDYFWADFVKSADLDRDGVVSRQEYLTYMISDEEITASISRRLVS